MFLGSLTLNCWYIHRSQQTAVKLLELLNSYKTSKGFLFQLVLRTWEFSSTCSLFLQFSPTDKFYPAQMVGFKSCICLYETFSFLLQNFQPCRGLIDKMAKKLVVQFNALLSFIHSKIFSILFHYMLTYDCIVFLSHERAIFATSQLMICFVAYSLQLF